MQKNLLTPKKVSANYRTQIARGAVGVDKNIQH